MEQICRICLSGSAALVDIFPEQEQTDEEPSLAEMLNECADCKVKSDDKLPKKICQACTTDARTAFRFKRRCEHSYKLLTLKMEDPAVEVDADAFCDMLEAEEWELPKRVLDMDCIKVENEESPERESCSPIQVSYVEHEEHSKMPIERHKKESCGESLQENNSPSNGDLPIEETVSNRYPSRQSKPKSYVELLSQNSLSDKSCSSDWSEKFEMEPNSDDDKLHNKKKLSVKRQFKCQECPKAFIKQKTLQAHRRTHTGERPYACPHCPKMFTLSHHARDHIRVHSGQRPHKCPNCSKAFSQKSNLQAHIHIHSAEGPFKCSYCTKTFSRNYDLKVHVRDHTGDRPYKCSHCSKAFNRRRDLERHIRVHTGEQPFKCAQCTAEFSRSDQLKTHMRKHVSGAKLERARRGRKKEANDKK